MTREKVSLYRGLSFNRKESRTLEEMEAELNQNGDPIDRGSCLSVPNIPHHSLPVALVLESLLSQEKEAVPRYCDKGLLCKYACGDLIGANHYAVRQNEPGLILHLEVDLSRLIIDGRDFLYTVVPRIIQQQGVQTSEIIDSLTQAFGEKILEYITLGYHLRDMKPDVSFRLVDYMCMDTEIIKAHLSSNLLIKGRANTIFKSAFGVIGDLKPKDIVRITKADTALRSRFEKSISIHDIFN